MAHQIGLGEFGAGALGTVVVEAVGVENVVKIVADFIGEGVALAQVEDGDAEGGDGVGPDDAGFVMAGLGIPPIGYINQLLVAVHLKDFVGGLFKALVFGVLIASIGCARGLNTGTGASGVGTATTSAVVSGIVLIIAADGIFSIAFYYLGF